MRIIDFSMRDHISERISNKEMRIMKRGWLRINDLLYSLEKTIDPLRSHFIICKTIHLLNWVAVKMK